MTKQGAVLLMVGVKTDKDTFTTGKLESITLPDGASCPHQWLPIKHVSTANSKLGGEYGWFVVGASEGGLGGTIFRLNWRDARSEPEQWIQLPRGDLILDIGWTKTKGWQAVITGGDPKCGEMPSWEEASIKCAQKKGLLYLVDESGHTLQISTPDSTGRCDALLDPTGAAIAFRESDQCFSTVHEEVSSRIVIADLASKQVWAVPGEERQYTPVWSPDGQWLAFVAEVKVGSLEVFPGENMALTSSQVQIVNVQSRQVRVLSQPDIGDPVAKSLVWSPDGRKLAWFRTKKSAGGEAASVLEVFDMADNKIIEIASLDRRNDVWWGTDWSPDGEIIIWGINKYGSGLEFGFHDLHTGEIHTLTVGTTYNMVWPRWSRDGKILGLVRDTWDRGFLDLIAWNDFNIKTTVELPAGIRWKELYWIPK